MSFLGIAVLTGSALLFTAAILCFAWFAAATQPVLLCAVAAAVAGALVSPLTTRPPSGLAFWAFLFACAAGGAGLNAVRNLRTRPTRWIHRFTIYSGYGATFAAMAALALVLHNRGTSGRGALVALILTYGIGSTVIFLAKALTVRHAARTMPEYQASLDTTPDNPGYW